MKRTYICLLCVIIIISTLVGCVPSKWAEYHPTSFPDTIWATVDNSVVIEIDSFRGGYNRGFINTEEGVKEVFFSLPSTPDVCVKINEQIEADEDECIEVWEAQIPEKDKFTVTVIKTTYFKVGDILVFYPVGENTNNDNHISRDNAEKKVQDAIPQKDYVQTAHFSRKETINNNVYFVFFTNALSWECLGDDYWIHEPVITHWVYIDAVTGEVHEVKNTENIINSQKPEGA